MRYKNFTWKLMVIAILTIALQPVQAQVVENDVVRVSLDRTPDEYSMLYVPDLINDPATAPIIFQIHMTPKVQNPEISLEVEFKADVPELGLNNEQIFWVQSNPFELAGELSMNNRDLAEQTNIVQTSNGPIRITASSENIEYIQGSQQDQLANSILSRATVPPGLYTLRYTIQTSAGELNDVVAVEFESRPNIQLVAPPNDAVIQTTYPVFQWESGGASRNCYYGIRVSEFAGDSREAALNDDSNLPFPDNQDYFIPENADATSLQYPLTGARELEEGKQYVWQVRKYCPTTRGEEIVESEIYAFTVGGDQVDPISIALESILGQDQFEQYFGSGGELAGYNPDQGSILIDGEVVSMSQLMNLSSQFNTGQYTIVNIQVVE